MARYAPFVTLGAVAVLGGTLLAVNIANSPVDPAGAIPARQAAAAAPDVAAAPAPLAPPAVDPPAAAPALGDRAYAGRSAGDEVTVALAVRDGRAVGYVCDGKRIEAWFEGTVEGGTLSLRGADGTATIAGTATESAALGSVTVAGKEWPFSAKGVDAPAGLYEGRADVRGVATRIGWIVTDDGAVTGVANAGGRRGPAPTLDLDDPSRVVIDGVPVAVTALDGGDRVIRR
jgi:hypothetical protein